MHEVDWEVSSDQKDAMRLGAELGEYVVHMRVLQGQGVLAQLADRLRLERRHGYAGIDVFIFLVGWLTCPEKLGMREFSYRTALHGQALAALGGRARWPSQASISRALKCCEAEQIQALSRWLLCEALPVLPVESDVSVSSRCAFAEQWHVFDFDPTVRTFRERALPEGDDLPVARRRASAMGEPGYPGRKRGERQMSRGALMHAGTGQWVGMWLHPGNGRGRQMMSEAASQAASWCTRRSIPGNRAVLRFDGGAGPGVPGVTACRESGVHWLTRASTSVLKEAAVDELLSTAVWRPVMDSMSGPRREATELGILRMVPSAPTRRADGSRFAPVETRVVISRFPVTQKTTGAGLTRDGWHYEVFQTSLPADHWPATDVVATYFGRSALENRFAQEDRELDLDRLASCHLPGQQLALLVGMFIWNLRLWLGGRMQELPPERIAPQPLRPAEERTVLPTCDEPPPPPPPKPQDPPPPTETSPVALSNAELADRLKPIITQLDWPALLARRRDGWRWDPSAEKLFCPQNLPFTLQTAYRAAHRHALIAVFQIEQPTCPSCPLREACMRSKATHSLRQFTFVLAHDNHPHIAQLLDQLAPSAAGSAPPSMPPPPPPRWRPPPTARPGPHLCVGSTLIPAQLRSRTRELARAETHVTLTVAHPARPDPAFATTAAQRQRRRWTWRQRHAHNSRHEGTTLRTRILATPAAKPLHDAAAVCVSA